MRPSGPVSDAVSDCETSNKRIRWRRKKCHKRKRRDESLFWMVEHITMKNFSWKHTRTHSHLDQRGLGVRRIEQSYSPATAVS